MCIRDSSYAVYDADGDLITTDQFPYLKGQGKIVCNEELIGFTIEMCIRDRCILVYFLEYVLCG